MKADAYLHASEGRYSLEIDKLTKIDRFGMEAVTGRRQLYFAEARQLVYAENIVNAYLARAQFEGWAQFEKASPVQAEILKDVEISCHL